jgi:hypothetical protein
VDDKFEPVTPNVVAAEGASISHVDVSVLAIGGVIEIRGVRPDVILVATKSLILGEVFSQLRQEIRLLCDPDVQSLRKMASVPAVADVNIVLFPM